MTQTTDLHRAAIECSERILYYFDSYKLGAVAPIVAEIEQALDAAYERGRKRGFTEVREMEEQLARYRAEDSDKDREMYRMQSAHAVALRREEEKGYRRGLIDQVFTNG